MVNDRVRSTGLVRQQVMPLRRLCKAHRQRQAPTARNMVLKHFHKTGCHKNLLYGCVTDEDGVNAGLLLLQALEHEVLLRQRRLAAEVKNNPCIRNGCYITVSDCER